MVNTARDDYILAIDAGDEAEAVAARIAASVECGNPETNQTARSHTLRDLRRRRARPPKAKDPKQFGATLAERIEALEAKVK